MPLRTITRGSSEGFSVSWAHAAPEKVNNNENKVQTIFTNASLTSELCNRPEGIWSAVSSDHQIRGYATTAEFTMNLDTEQTQRRDRHADPDDAQFLPGNAKGERWQRDKFLLRRGAQGCAWIGCGGSRWCTGANLPYASPMSGNPARFDGLVQSIFG